MADLGTLLAKATSANPATGLGIATALGSIYFDIVAPVLPQIASV